MARADGIPSTLSQSNPPRGGIARAPVSDGHARFSTRPPIDADPLAAGCEVAPEHRPHAKPSGWVLAVLILFALLVVVAVSGCGWRSGFSPANWFSAPTPKVPAASVPSDPFWWLPWLAGLCAAFGVVALIAGTFIPLIPRKAAATAIGCAIGAGILKAFLAKFLGVMLWGAFGLLVVSAVLVLWPWIAGLRNWSINRLGYKLATNGHRDAGIALMSAARGLVKPSHKALRLALAAKVPVATTEGAT